MINQRETDIDHYSEIVEMEKCTTGIDQKNIEGDLSLMQREVINESSVNRIQILVPDI